MTDAPNDETVEAAAPATAPLIQILGDATPEQVAALVAVRSAAAGAAADDERGRHTPQWSAPARVLRRPVAPAPGAWHHPLNP